MNFQDVGKSILESYSRVLESLSFNIVARIDDLLYVDDLTKHSDRMSSAPTVSVIAHKTVSIPFSVPDSSTPYRTTFSTPSFSPAPLISPARGERTPFLINNHSKPHRRGLGVKRVLTNYLGVETKTRICGNPTEALAAAPKQSGTEGLAYQKESSAHQNGTKLRQDRWGFVCYSVPMMFSGKQWGKECDVIRELQKFIIENLLV